MVAPGCGSLWIDALKNNRYAYTPPPPSIYTAHLYVQVINLFTNYYTLVTEHNITSTFMSVGI